MSKKVMISAGEPSGELYGALLGAELKKKWPDTDIFGIGGPQMERQGIELVAPISNIIGFTEALRNIRDIRKNLKRAKKALTERRPDILVLIDYPDFNLSLANKARTAGIPILYYVSPQVWAWRMGRVKKIASRVNKIALLFPFEVALYRKAGLACEYVGHPLAELIGETRAKKKIKEELGLDPHRPVVTLLPGSRPTELRMHLPIMKEVAEKIHREMPGFQVVFPFTAETELTEDLMDYVTVLKGKTREAVAMSEATAVASGTATLEAALLQTPLVVFYRVSSLSYMIAKLLIRIKHISLVNLLSGKDVVVELIQKHATSENIFSELEKILTDNAYRSAMLSNLVKIRGILGEKRTSARVATIVGEIAGWNSTSAS